AAHPEYDDRYWRYVRDFAVEPTAATFTKVDSAVWEVVAPRGLVTVRYRIVLPPAPPGPRAAWRPFLTPSGGLLGGPHAFMYLIGAERMPATVTLDLPPSWGIATGLASPPDPLSPSGRGGTGRRTFTAANAATLVDSPILIGHFHDWQFTEAGVPHRVVYWLLPDAAAFDTAAFLAGVKGIVHQTITLFGRAPYRDYTFLFQDGAYGALEHGNSVTLGAPSNDLASDPRALRDHPPSTQPQGQLIGTMLDLIIRDATDGRRTMDDVMRLLFDPASPPVYHSPRETNLSGQGIDGRGIEQAVETVCSCDVTPFFDAHVRGAGAIDFDRYLGLIGLKTTVTSAAAVYNGEPERDLRMFGYEPEGDSGVKLIVSNPASIWGRAGLHSRDRLERIDGASVKTWPELRTKLQGLRMG